MRNEIEYNGWGANGREIFKSLEWKFCMSSRPLCHCFIGRLVVFDNKISIIPPYIWGGTRLFENVHCSFCTMAYICTIGAELCRMLTLLNVWPGASGAPFQSF